MTYRSLSNMLLWYLNRICMLYLKRIYHGSVVYEQNLYVLDSRHNFYLILKIQMRNEYDYA